jgi:hypothetical protein
MSSFGGVKRKYGVVVRAVLPAIDGSSFGRKSRKKTTALVINGKMLRVNEKERDSFPAAVFFRQLDW